MSNYFSISIFGIGYFFLGVFAILLSILAVVVYFIDAGKDYTKVIFDYSGNRLYLTSGSIYSSDKIYYLSDMEEVKLQTRKFDSFTSAFKAGNKDYVRNITVTIKSINLIIISIVSDSESTDVEIEQLVSYLHERIQ